MSKTRLGVGIIGYSRAGAGPLWRMFRCCGLAGSRATSPSSASPTPPRASAEAATRASDLPRAFVSVSALIANPEVDVAVVTVKVPHHFAIV